MRWARIEDQNDAAGVEMPFTSLREMSGATDRDRERRQSAQHQAFRRVLHDVARDDFVQAPSAAQVYMRWARKADKRGGSAHMPSSMRQGGVEATKGADRPTAAAARAASAGVTLYRGLVGSPSSRAWSTTPIGWASVLGVPAPRGHRKIGGSAVAGIACALVPFGTSRACQNSGPLKTSRVMLRSSAIAGISSCRLP